MGSDLCLSPIFLARLLRFFFYFRSQPILYHLQALEPSLCISHLHSCITSTSRYTFEWTTHLEEKVDAISSSSNLLEFSDLIRFHQSWTICRERPWRLKLCVILVLKSKGEKITQKFNCWWKGGHLQLGFHLPRECNPPIESRREAVVEWKTLARNFITKEAG